MELARLVLLGLGLSIPAAGAEPPPLTVELGSEAQELAARKRWNPREGWTALAALRAGRLAGPGGVSYPVLKASPYALGQFKAVFSGRLESAVMGTLGYANIRSARAFPGYPEEMVLHSQNVIPASGYADAGAVFPVSEAAKAALYAAVEGFAFMAPGGGGNSGIGTAFAHAGGAVLSRSGSDEALLAGSLDLEAGHKNMYSNWDVTAAPSGSLRAEVSRGAGAGAGASRLSAGAEAGLRRADVSLRPYAGYGGERGSVLAAVELRKSLHPFFPDRVGLGASAGGALSRGVDLSGTAFLTRDRYALDPRPAYTARGGASLSFSTKRAAVEAGGERGAKSPAAGFEPREAEPLRARLVNADSEAHFRRILLASPSLDEFSAAIGARSLEDILATLSIFTQNFVGHNYNDDEVGRRNVVGASELYVRARASFLAGAQDPILVCIGSAEFAAELALELGRRAGLELSATAVSVNVPGGRHAVTMIKTRESGIVFVDWGTLTPAGTHDTEEAFRVYQGLAGVPEVFHDVTDAGKNGRHVSYLYSREGKLFLRRFTFHNEAETAAAGLFGDAPDGAAVARERYLGLLRR